VVLRVWNAQGSYMEIVGSEDSSRKYSRGKLTLKIWRKGFIKFDVI
jgi:hypothetical protein